MESQSTYSTEETDREKVWLDYDQDSINKRSFFAAVDRIESIMPALMQLFRDGEIGGTDEGWQSMIEILDQHLFVEKIQDSSEDLSKVRKAVGDLFSSTLPAGSWSGPQIEGLDELYKVVSG